MGFKVVFVTQEDPFYVRIFFEELLARYPDRSEIAAVVVAPAMGKKSTLRLARQMYDFYGPVDFLRVGTRFACYRVASLLARFVRLPRFFSVREVCDRYEVPVWHVPNLNAPDFVERLGRESPDLIASVAAPQIFKAPLIAAARLGCINIHNSKLPKYRGMLPNFWQMFHGEKTVGTTVHRINESLDDGEILVQREQPIAPGESLDALIRRTKRDGARLMLEAIENLRAGRVRGIANLRDQASYFTFPSRSDVREFRRRGYRLV